LLTLNSRDQGSEGRREGADEESAERGGAHAVGLRCRDGTVAIVVSAVVETLHLCEALDRQGDAM